MNFSHQPVVTRALARAAAPLMLALCTSAALAQAPAPAPGGGMAADPRAETRTYHFADAKQDLQYCVFKSSKVTRDTPAPLIVSLHGMGAPPTIMCNKTAIDLAEAGGYVLVAPMGYNTTGWFGSPVISFGAPGRGPGTGPGPGAGAGAGPGARAPGAAPPPGAAPAGAPATTAAAGTATSTCPAPPARAAGPGPGRGAVPGAAGGRPRGAGPGAAGAAPAIDPEQLAKWSEADVMNVLDMARKEFNIDPKRIYLTGHSMGGAGTYFLGAKHADIWAAIAPVAPASFMMNDTRAQILGRIKNAGVPILVVTGDADEVVSPANTRMWVDTIKELGMNYEYVEQPCVTHGPVITTSQEPIFAFFGKHRKK
jgi:poly(3-hydroxybutyrate) depolymerase